MIKSSYVMGLVKHHFYHSVKVITPRKKYSFEKINSLFTRANNGIPKKVVLDGLLSETLSVKQFSPSFDIYYNMVNQIIGSGG